MLHEAKLSVIIEGGLLLFMRGEGEHIEYVTPTCARYTTQENVTETEIQDFEAIITEPTEHGISHN